MRVVANLQSYKENLGGRLTAPVSSWGRLNRRNRITWWINWTDIKRKPIGSSALFPSLSPVSVDVRTPICTALFITRSAVIVPLSPCSCILFLLPRNFLVSSSTLPTFQAVPVLFGFPYYRKHCPFWFLKYVTYLHASIGFCIKDISGIDYLSSQIGCR